MPKVFISYRRDDSRWAAQAIYDKLAEHYGKESVLFDVDTIPLGVDFVKYLNQQVSECDVLLAVVGERWLDMPAEDGRRRIDDPKDFVRIEIQAALKRDIPVVPVLIDNASMPAEAQLPRGLKRLSRRNATEVHAGRDLHTHLGRLVQDIEVSLKHVSQTPPSKRTTADLTVRPASTLAPEDADKDVITNSIGMQLKLFAAGSFLMGAAESDQYARDYEKPQHQVSLTEFELGVYPVTQADYERVMGKNPSHFKGDNRRPVESINWFDAIDFCIRVSKQEGLPPYYNVQRGDVATLGGEGYRLPREAEWEYACRAGSKGAYCFGDDKSRLGQYAWFAENSESSTHPVGQKQPNARGLYDMHGNVLEWCWDWYDNYPTSPQNDPVGPYTGLLRVNRGGGWSFVARFCRSAYRGRSDPEFRSRSLGFRLARSPSGKSSQ